MSDFGQRLRQARKQKGFTQKDLSKRLGVAQSTIANYETNERFPGELALKELADCLKVSVDYLLGISENPKSFLIDTTETSKSPLVGSNQAESQHLYNLLIHKKEHEAAAYVKTLTEKYGPLDLMHSVFEPVMQAVGLNWQEGKIDISTEHYITGVMEYLVAISATSPHYQSANALKPYKVALLVPGAEEHVLTLKMAAEYFRHAGWQVYYLGRSLPFSSLSRLISEQAIDIIALSITMPQHLNSAEHLVQALRLNPSISKCKILISGQALDGNPSALQLMHPDYYVPTLEALGKLIPEIESNLVSKSASF